MNITSKTILASTLLVVLFSATSANAEGRAAGPSDYDENAVATVEIKKVSIEVPAVNFEREVNR